MAVIILYALAFEIPFYIVVLTVAILGRVYNRAPVKAPGDECYVLSTAV